MALRAAGRECSVPPTCTRRGWDGKLYGFVAGTRAHSYNVSWFAPRGPPCAFPLGARLCSPAGPCGTGVPGSQWATRVASDSPVREWRGTESRGSRVGQGQPRRRDSGRATGVEAGIGTRCRGPRVTPLEEALQRGRPEHALREDLGVRLNAVCGARVLRGAPLLRGSRKDAAPHFRYDSDGLNF